MGRAMMEPRLARIMKREGRRSSLSILTIEGYPPLCNTMTDRLSLLGLNGVAEALLIASSPFPLIALALVLA